MVAVIANRVNKAKLRGGARGLRARAVRSACEAARALLHGDGRHASRIRRARERPAARPGRNLADSSRAGLGEPGVAALAGAARRTAHRRPIRRARLRAFRHERRRSIARHVGRRSRGGRRCGGPGAIRAARHLPGRRDRRRVRGTTSGPRLRPRPLRRVCARPKIPRRGRRGRRAPRRDPRGLDGAESGVPPGVQHALPPATARRSKWPGTRICSGDTTSAEAATRLFRARGGLDVSELAPQVRARTLGHARAGRPSGAGRRGPGRSPR